MNDAAMWEPAKRLHVCICLVGRVGGRSLAESGEWQAAQDSSALRIYTTCSTCCRADCPLDLTCEEMMVKAQGHTARGQTPAPSLGIVSLVFCLLALGWRNFQPDRSCLMPQPCRPSLFQSWCSGKVVNHLSQATAMSCCVDRWLCDLSHYNHGSPPTAPPFCQAIRLDVAAVKAEIALGWACTQGLGLFTTLGQT